MITTSGQWNLGNGVYIFESGRCRLVVRLQPFDEFFGQVTWDGQSEGLTFRTAADARSWCRARAIQIAPKRSSERSALMALREPGAPEGQPPEGDDVCWWVQQDNRQAWVSDCGQRRDIEEASCAFDLVICPGCKKPVTILWHFPPPEFLTGEESNESND